MRNFSSSIDASCTYVLDDSTTFTDPAFVRIQRALMVSMGANPDTMTPSEEGVLADFIGWVKHNLEVCCRLSMRGEGWDIGDVGVLKPVFTYHNLNEGHSVAVVWVDDKRKLAPYI